MEIGDQISGITYFEAQNLLFRLREEKEDNTLNFNVYKRNGIMYYCLYSE